MLTFLARLHGLLFRGCLWLLMLPLRALWAAFLAVLMLLGEEVRRYTGLAISGLLIVVIGKVAMNYAPPTMGRPVALAALAMLALWALAVRRAIHLTRANNLFRVRNRQYFRKLSGEVGGLRGRLDNLRDELGRRARGTPLGGMWRSNRDDRDREQAETEAAAAQTERDRLARENYDRWAEQAGAEHNPFERQGA